MNYVKYFSIFGVDAQQITCATGIGAPTSRTKAAVGCLYMNVSSDNKDIYKCVGATNGTYTWTKIGEGSSFYVKQNLTEAQKQQARQNIDAVGSGDIGEINTTLYNKQDTLGWLTEEDIDAMFDGTYDSENVTIIDFIIEGASLQAEKDMIWREWVNSKYNVDNKYFYVEDTDTIRTRVNSSYYDVKYRSDTPVKGPDPIVPGFYYYYM